MCDKTVYQIRPYTFEILRAIQPFFEIVATSNLHYDELDQIIEHIECVLNKPLIDLVIKDHLQPPAQTQDMPQESAI